MILVKYKRQIDQAGVAMLLSDKVKFKHTEWDQTVCYAVAQKVQFMCMCDNQVHILQTV